MEWNEEWDKLKVWWRSTSGNYRGSQPTANFDRAMWFDAAMQREPQAKVWNRTQVRRFLMMRNGLRWRRMQKDINYFQRQLTRAQVYEDVRLYL